MKKTILILILLCICFVNAKPQIIVGDSISANIYYKNLHDTAISCSTSSGPCTVTKDLDVDNDGMNDLRFYHYFFTAMGADDFEQSIIGLNSNFWVAVTSTDSLSADTFRKGILIDKTKKWSNHSSHALQYYNWSGGASTTTYGIYDTNPRYLGFKIITVSDTLYGWFLLQLQKPSCCYTGIILHSYAIQKPNIGVETFDREKSIAIYPNPGIDKIYIEVRGNIEKEIKIYDVLGYNVKQQNTITEKIIIDVSELQNGIYFVGVKTSEGILTRKIVVQR